MRVTSFIALIASTWAQQPFDIVAVAPAVPNRGPAKDEVTIIQHSFGNSYGTPATAQYTAPSFDFSHVQLELDMSSYGNQYDRLAHIYLEGVEIWRPSTPEPGSKTIVANMTKDVSQYVALFKQSGTLTFQLDNVMDQTYTGPFDCTLKIRYFDPGQVETEQMQWYYSDTAPTDVKSIQSSLLSSTPQSTVTIPKVSGNTYRIGVSIYATGNAQEEFYYTNSESSSGPTRLVQLFINDQLAGYVDPFQPIYTGGMQPHLWYPIVGVNAYDIPSHYIDLSPWLPLLWKQETKVELKVINGYNDEAVRDNWLINVALVEWQDKNLSGTGGSMTMQSNSTSSPTYVSKDTSSGHLGYVGFTNSLSLTSQLYFSDGSARTVRWKQSSDSRNAQLIGTGSQPQYYLSYQKGSSAFTSNLQTYSRDYEYPLGLYFSSSNAIGVNQGYIISNNGANGVTSVSNHIKGGWGDGEPNETDAQCAWVDKGASYVRTASAKNNDHLSDSTTGGSGSLSGSWSETADNLKSLAGSNNIDGLASALSGLAKQYSSGSQQSLNARDLESREMPYRCPPNVCRTPAKRDTMPFRCPPNVCRGE